MTRIFVLAVIALLSLGAWSRGARAQTRPVSWRLSRQDTKPVAPGSVFWVSMVATIAPRWHLYAHTQPPGGPIATSFTIGPSPGFLTGTAILARPAQLAPDPTFGIVSEWYEDSVTFRIPVVAGRSTTGPSQLTVRARYQSCSSKLCLPPREDTLTVGVKVR